MIPAVMGAMLRALAPLTLENRMFSTRLFPVVAGIGVAVLAGVVVEVAVAVGPVVAVAVGVPVVVVVACGVPVVVAPGVGVKLPVAKFPFTVWPLVVME